MGRYLAIALLCVTCALPLAAGVTQPAADDTAFVNPAPFGWPGAGSLGNARRQWQIQRTAAERLRSFPDSPHTVAWLSNAGRVGDALDALARVVERQPARLTEALAAFNAHDVQMDQTRGHKARAREIVTAAQQTLGGLDREVAARAATALLPLEMAAAEQHVEYITRLRAVAAAYPGTEAARLAEVEIAVNGRPGAQTLARLEAIAASQPGTEVAARAQYLKGFSLAHNGQLLVLDGGSADPSGRFLEVVEIVKDLESGRYPPNPWTEQATGLVTGFNMFQPQLPPESAARMFQGYVAFITGHLSMLGGTRDGDAMEFAVTNRLAQTAAFMTDGVAAMERQFAAFEREWPDRAAARYLKASWLDIRKESMPWPIAVAPASPTREAEVRSLLLSASAAGDGFYSRRALASLAEREFSDPASLPGALAHYVEYQRRFATADEAWVAALRAGQVEQAQGRAPAAARRFAEAASARGLEPIARVLGRAYAGRASEEASAFDAAREHYRAALAAWSPDLGIALSLDLPPSRSAPRAPGDPLAVNRTVVQRAELERREREIAGSLAADGGVELERGRWLLNQGRPREALSVLERVARQYQQLTTGAAARAVLRRARLDAAIAHAESTNPKPDVSRALEELDRLALEPFDTSGGIAAITAATLRMLQGQGPGAAATMTAALRRWVAEAPRLATTPAAGSLEHDVLAVRDAVFLPMGGGLLVSGWNAAAWPARMPSFILAPSKLRVTTAGDEAWVEVNVSSQPAGLSNVVFIARDDVEYLNRAIPKIGGTRRREPTAIMEVPNQPMGDARAIVQWWNQFFPARPGHWGGFEILTYPVFSAIEFTNPERTRALVPIAVGYSGATVVLEKPNGVWTMVALVNRWIT